jgi:uracil-DNA glycosylase
MMQPQSSLFGTLPKPWRELLKGEEQLLDGIESKISVENFNPDREKIFNAFQIYPEDIKVVILGQDPYPNREYADGLAFSIPENGEKIPASLRNILREYQDDLNLPPRVNGDLTAWTRQGVFLLNTILTCRSGESLSHENIGWEKFTDQVLRSVVHPEMVGILWGKRAQGYSHLFSPEMIIESAHPSPLSAYRGFFGSKPFSRTNALLENRGITKIEWSQQNV